MVEAASDQLLSRAPAQIQYLPGDDLAASAQMNLAVIDQEIGAGANIYAIWFRQAPEVVWKPMYVGQRTRGNVKERIRQHLFQSPNGTQSKLNEVRALVEAGYFIGISTVLVSPDPLRLAVEDQIIFLNTNAPDDLPWNNKSRNVLRA